MKLRALIELIATIYGKVKSDFFGSVRFIPGKIGTEILEFFTNIFQEFFFFLNEMIFFFRQI